MLTVIVAIRWVVLKLSEAVTVTVPLFAPVFGEIVSHVGSSLLTVQFVLEMTLKVRCWLAEVKLKEFCDTVSAGIAPACVTLIVLGVTSVPLTVIVAVRCVKPVLAVTFTVTVPLFAPVAGDTVSHVSLLLTIHSVLELMLKLCSWPSEVKLKEFCDTVNVGVSPACVTFID